MLWTHVNVYFTCCLFALFGRVQLKSRANIGSGEKAALENAVYNLANTIDSFVSDVIRLCALRTVS